MSTMPPHILQPFLEMRAARPMLAPHRRIRVRSEDAVELLVGVFEPDPPQAQDVVLFFHGAGAHMAAGYLDLGAELHQLSACAVLLPDLRGHGRSGGARGELAAPAVLWRDVDALVRCALERYPHARLHVGGHSLGAGLALNWMCHGADVAALARQGRLQSLLLLAPYTHLKQADRARAPGQAPFITRPDGDHGDAQFDYSAEIATRAGLVRRIQAALFDALAPADFLAQLRQVLCELRIPVSALLLRDDELFDAAALQALLEPLAAPGEARLRVDCIPGAHLSGLFSAADAIAAAMVWASHAEVPA